MTMGAEAIPAFLRVLGDGIRLRILGLLAQAELSVGEIARCLAVGQSRVSNHLKILREAGVLAERREGSFTFCRLEAPNGTLVGLWEALQPALVELEEAEADGRRLAVVLAERGDGRAFFDRVAGDWDLIGSDFSRGTGRLEVLGCLVANDLVVADIGCGTGYLAKVLARRVGKVICVDTSSAMLSEARERLEGSEAVLEYRRGAMESLPLTDDEADAACAHMVLHHLPDPRPGIAEMVRVVRPGGVVACLDLLPHHETWMHERMADTRLGLDPASLADDFAACGLEDVAREMVSDNYVVEHPSGRTIELPLYLMRGRKAA